MATTNYYTRDYVGVPTSYGYSSKNDVSSLQHQLNSMGAKLTLDGIWGPQTDAAYNKYMGANSQSQQTPGGGMSYQQSSYGAYNNSGQPGSLSDYMGMLGGLGSMPQMPTFNYQPTTLERIAFTPRSDADIQALAEGTVNPTYDRYFQQLEQGLARNQLDLQHNQEDLVRQKNDLTAQTATEYDAQRAYLEANAVSRGMGRSSYLTDTLANSQINENAAIQRINENWQTEHNQINDNIARLGEDYNNAKAQGERERMEQIQSQISQLREYDRQLSLDVQKFNADQGYREATINSQMQQMAYESQLASAQAQMQYQMNQQQMAMQLYGQDRDYANQFAMQQQGYQNEMAMLQEQARLSALNRQSSGGGSSGGGASGFNVYDYLADQLGSLQNTDATNPLTWTSGNYNTRGASTTGGTAADYRSIMGIGNQSKTTTQPKTTVPQPTAKADLSSTKYRDLMYGY